MRHSETRAGAEKMTTAERLNRINTVIVPLANQLALLTGSPQDNVTICGFFQTVEKFDAHAGYLRDRIAASR